MQVKDHKPANIKIYDYYMPGEFRCCTAKTAQIYFWKKKKIWILLSLRQYYLWHGYLTVP